MGVTRHLGLHPGALRLPSQSGRQRVVRWTHGFRPPAGGNATVALEGLLVTTHQRPDKTACSSAQLWRPPENEHICQGLR